MEDVAKLLTVKQAAEFLHLSEHTIRAWILEGRLTKIKVGQKLTFVRESELLAFIRPEPKKEQTK